MFWGYVRLWNLVSAGENRDGEYLKLYEAKSFIGVKITI
jgi:hypothetical protein